jgi:hypothetical protein
MPIVPGCGCEEPGQSHVGQDPLRGPTRHGLGRSIADALSGMRPLSSGLLEKRDTKAMKSGSAQVLTSSHAHQGQALRVGPRALTPMLFSHLSGTDPEAKATATSRSRR